MTDQNTAIALELEATLQYLIEHLSEAQGSRDADCGYVTGKHFQMITMCPDPKGLADAINKLPAILAALRTPAPAPVESATPPVHPGDKWIERWCGSGMWRGSSIWTADSLGCHKNMIEHVGGDEETHAYIRRIVSAHNAALQAQPAPMGGDVVERACDAFMSKITVDGNGGIEFLEEGIIAALAAMQQQAPVADDVGERS